ARVEDVMARSESESLARLFRRGPSWWLDYKEDGKRVRRSLRTPYLSDARMVAAKVEGRLRRKAVGIEDADAAYAAQPIAEHVAAFRVTMEARGGTARHVVRTVKYLQDGIAAIGAERIRHLDLATASRWLE